MKKGILAIVFLTLNVVFVFSLEEQYIVFSDNVNIRNAPSINSSVIRIMSYPDPITVYELKGSGEYINGILDKWARINMNSSEWINYFYIAKIPFVVRFNGNPQYDSKDSIVIKAIYKEDSTYFFESEWLLNPYYHKDINFKMPANASLDIYLGYSLPIKDNACARLYNLCENFNDNLKKYPADLYNKKYTETLITNPNILLDYGIKIGVDKDQIITTLGVPTEQTSDFILYEAFYIGYGYRIKFSFEKNIVTSIWHELEK